MMHKPLGRAERDRLAQRIRNMRRLRTQVRNLTALVEQLRDEVEGVAAEVYAAAYPEVDEALDRIAKHARRK